MGGLFFFGVVMDIRKCILERSHYRTNVAIAFLKAIGAKPRKRKYVTITTDETSDIRECFKNKRRIRL